MKHLLIVIVILLCSCGGGGSEDPDDGHSDSPHLNCADNPKSCI